MAGADYQAAIELAFSAPGIDSIGQADDAIGKLADLLDVLKTQFSENSIQVDQFVKGYEQVAKALSKAESLRDSLIESSDEYRAMQEALGRAEKAAADAAVAGAAATARARQAGIEAIEREVQAIEAARVAEIKAMGDRAQAYARAEREREAAAKQAAQADGDALRARIEAYARAERAQEAADRAGAQSAGEAMRARIEAYARAERAQEAADRAGAQSAGEAMRARIDALARAERQTDAWRESMTKLEPATRRAGDGGGYAALKFLYLSNAIQDLQYGVGAVVNNLPGLVQSFGGTAGLAGGIQLAGVAAQILVAHLDDIVKFFQGGDFGAIPSSIEALTAKLKELESIKVKTSIDSRDIDIAQQKLDLLQAAQSNYDRVRNKRSKAQQEASDRATTAIVEYGPGTDYDSGIDKLSDVAANLSKPAESVATREAARQLEMTRAAAANPANAMGAGALYAQIPGLEKALADSKSADKASHLAEIRKRVGLAAGGYENDVDWLLNLVRGNGDAFTQAGVQEGFAQALGGATRGRVNADAYDKADKKLTKKSDTEDAKFEKWQDEQDRDDADRTSKNWVKAEREATQAREKAEREATQARNAAGRAAAKTARDLAAEAKEVAPGFQPAIESAVALNRLKQLRGAPVARSAREARGFEATGQDYALPEANVRNLQTRQTADNLRAAGQDPALAANIVGAAIEKVGDTYAKNLAQTGNQFASLLAIVEASQLGAFRAANVVQQNDAKLGKLRADMQQRRVPTLQNPPPGF